MNNLNCCLISSDSAFINFKERLIAPLCAPVTSLPNIEEEVTGIDVTEIKRGPPAAHALQSISASPLKEINQDEDAMLSMTNDSQSRIRKRLFSSKRTRLHSKYYTDVDTY